VVIATAVGVAGAEWAASLGAAGYLRKPFDTEELVRLARRFCRQGLPDTDEPGRPRPA
jgi:hypothetical protein